MFPDFSRYKKTTFFLLLYSHVRAVLLLNIDAELRGDLDKNLDPGQEVGEDGEGSGGDHGVDRGQGTGVVVAADRDRDRMEAV